MTVEEIEAGNKDRCKTLDVLHKIASDNRKHSRLAVDVFEEVKLLQDVYKEMDVDQEGFIQHFSSISCKVSHDYIN